MCRTLLVLLFLGACGVYFHQNGSAPAPSPSAQNGKAENRILDDSSLQELKKFLPAQLFEKDVKPVIEQNRREGLSAEQISQFLNRLRDMSVELGGKASEVASNAAESLEDALPRDKSMPQKSVESAGEFARKTRESVKESLPALKEISGEILNGMVAVLSQLLTAATELLKK